MDRQEFKEWLINYKGKNIKSSYDILSRLTRVAKLINSIDVNQKTLDSLNSSLEYKNMSAALRSSLKRAVELAIEFQKAN